MKAQYILFITFLLSCNSSNQSNPSAGLIFHKVDTPIILDGNVDIAWDKADWINIDQKWLGPDYSPNDFSGRYKCLWDKNYLYLLAEIKDDTLIDIHKDPLVSYWDDDCLEIFVDENRSKGDHQYNHNAFAYHVGLDGFVADIGTDKNPQQYKHLNSARKTNSLTNTSIWEAQIEIYSDKYVDGGDNQPLTLVTGKKIGFAVAYCDNDRSLERENFIGSVVVQGEDKNRGWIDAGIFGEVVLGQ